MEGGAKQPAAYGIFPQALAQRSAPLEAPIKRVREEQRLGRGASGDQVLGSAIETIDFS